MRSGCEITNARVTATATVVVTAARHLLLPEHLLCWLSQVVVACHRATIRAGGVDQDDIPLLAGMYSTCVAKHIASLADRTDDFGMHEWAISVEAREVDNVVVGAIECGPNQRIEAGADANVHNALLVLDLRHLRYQHSTSSNQEAAYSCGLHIHTNQRSR
jgi:hypothetical protein